VATLPAQAQEVLGMAAVIGRVVPRLLLATAAAQPEGELLAALDVLCTAHLVREDGADAYRFPHDVIREVVETDLGAARRALLHRRVAQALEGQPGTPPIERLAYHYSQGEMWAQALAYLVQAGDKAAAAHANRDALSFYTQALAVCETLGEAALPTVLTVAQRRGDLHILLLHGSDAAADYERMAEAARRRGDRHREGLALVHRGDAEMVDGSFETAEATLRAALVVDGEGDDEVCLHAGLALDYCLTVTGRLAEADALLREVRGLARQRCYRPLQDRCDLAIMFRYVFAGRFDEALAVWSRGEATPLAGHPADLLSTPSSNAALASWITALAIGGMGDYTAALRILHALIMACERMGEVWTWKRALNMLGWLYGELQDHQQALEWNTRGVQAAQERGAPETNPEAENNARLNLGDTLLALGRLDDAEEQFRAVERMVRTPRPRDRSMQWRYAQHLFHSHGELWLARGDATRALAYADECLALAEPTNSRKNVVKGRRLRGQALLAQGRLAEAAREVDAALQVAQEVGNPCQLWRTYAARGDLCRAQGRAQDARTAYHAALAIIERVAAALDDALLRDTFLMSAYVEDMRQRARLP
jgi:tetratricopeptide (TPR) repeat protein